MYVGRSTDLLVLVEAGALFHAIPSCETTEDHGADEGEDGNHAPIVGAVSHRR
jgi:hypothetical protein